ncbi:hypothetical protein DID96_22040 [Burkholderia sp. Bp8963]|nr:hypothetical protein DID96_22040 [Burkholderia sp. Bp8963]
MSAGYPVQVFEDGILSVSDLAIDGENAFSVDYTDGVKWLNKVDGEFKILSKAFYSDRKNVFDQSFRRIDGLSPDQFSVVMPVCPIPGQPDLRCVAMPGSECAKARAMAGFLLSRCQIFAGHRLDFLLGGFHGSAVETLHIVVGAIGFEPTTL